MNCGDEPAPVKVNLRGKAEKTVLTSACADDANTAFEPEKVKPVTTEVDFTGEDVLPPLSLSVYVVESK